MARSFTVRESRLKVCCHFLAYALNIRAELYFLALSKEV